MARIIVSQEETSVAPWLNRKFMTPLFAAIATIVVLFAEQALPTFDIPNTLLAEILSAVWFVVVPFIVGGDILYDNLRVLLNLIIQVIDLRNEPPAQG